LIYFFAALVLTGAVFCVCAGIKASAAVKKYSDAGLPDDAPLTGAEACRMLFKRAKAEVPVTRGDAAGYDAAAKTLTLAAAEYNGKTILALAKALRAASPALTKKPRKNNNRSYIIYLSFPLLPATVIGLILGYFLPVTVGLYIILTASALFAASLVITLIRLPAQIKTARKIRALLRTALPKNILTHISRAFSALTLSETALFHKQIEICKNFLKPRNKKSLSK